MVDRNTIPKSKIMREQGGDGALPIEEELFGGKLAPEKKYYGYIVPYSYLAPGTEFLFFIVKKEGKKFIAAPYSDTKALIMKIGLDPDTGEATFLSKPTSSLIEMNPDEKVQIAGQFSNTNKGNGYDLTGLLLLLAQDPMH